MSSDISLLLGLLVLSYLGSVLVGKRATRDFAMLSGAEYLVLGFVLGPVLLGVIGRELLSTFGVISRVGAAWLGLLAGLGYGVATRRSLSRAAIGVVLTALVGASVATAIWFAAGLLWQLSVFERGLLALGAALLCCATTHNMSPWFAKAKGSALGQSGVGGLGETLRDLARASALVPVIALAVALSIAPDHGLVDFTWWQRAGITLGTGVLLGVMATLLLGREFRVNESWALILGLVTLGAGVAVRVGLSAVALAFCLGLTLSLMSRHGDDIRAMIGPTEKPVMLPVALLTGAALDPAIRPWAAAFVAIALGARLLAELVRGLLLVGVLRTARKAGPLLGLAMTTTGGFTLAAAVELNHALPSPVGPLLLLLAAAGAVLGAVLGPWRLRRALQRTGELLDAADESQPVADSDVKAQGTSS